MVQYLLPCQCGRKTPVDSAKAGQTIECECGAKLEVPTLGGLKNLERVVTPKPATKTTWGPRQQVLLIGIIICATGLGIAGYFRHYRPLPPPRELRIELIPKHVESLSLMQTLALWGALERGLPEHSALEQQAYQKARDAYHRRAGVALFIAAVGLVMMVISLFIPKKHSRHRPPGKPPGHKNLTEAIDDSTS